MSKTDTSNGGSNGDMATKVWREGIESLCDICHEPFVGMGHNARPLNDGRCCSECNIRYVLAFRLMDMTLRDYEEKINDLLGEADACTCCTCGVLFP